MACHGDTFTIIHSQPDHPNQELKFKPWNLRTVILTYQTHSTIINYHFSQSPELQPFNKIQVQNHAFSPQEAKLLLTNE